MKVAVLKGGRSLERGVSLRSGARVEAALRRLGHDVVSVDVGLDLIQRLRESEPDVAFVALHGEDGEVALATADEIAESLYLSVNTVKTHLKSIYRKLDVPDRRAAVRRARELELLAP